MKYTLVLYQGGDIVGTRSLKLDGKDLGREEFDTARKARELYRDAMYARGLWRKPVDIKD